MVIETLVVAAAATGGGKLAIAYTWAGIVIGVACVLGGIRFLYNRVTPFFKFLHRFKTDWDGEPAREGVDARPGVMYRLHTIEFDVKGMKAELHPDHGQSLKDDVTSMKGQVTELVNWKRTNQDLVEFGQHRMKELGNEETR